MVGMIPNESKPARRIVTGKTKPAQRMVMGETQAPEEAPQSSVGPRIRARRKELNLSQRELAEKTQTSQEIISNYEQNITPIRVNDLQRLCVALRVSMSYFFHEGQWDDDYVFAENGDHQLHDAEKENELLSQYRKLTRTSQNMVVRITYALALQEKELNG